MFAKPYENECLQSEEVRREPSTQKDWYDFIKQRGEMQCECGNYRGSALFEHKTGA